MERTTFPFAAVIGQNDIKNALIWNVVNPRIGGVLISGEKGTAKSTLVRGLVGIADKALVELPLNTTEDRLIGAIDFESAVKTGERALEHGLLKQAHDNILYVDEVNLLSDNIVKSLLDTASSGVCLVEREGVSDAFAAEFTLVGSMNPEEGGLRPQFLDRFGLYVQVEGETDVNTRADIVARRIEFEADNAVFAKRYDEDQECLKRKIQKAQARLQDVTISSAAKTLIAQMVRDANCSGHRAELVIAETAKAIVAYAGRDSVDKDAVTEAAKYALPHRARQWTPPPEMETPPGREQQEQEPSETPAPPQQTVQQDAPPQEEMDSGAAGQRILRRRICGMRTTAWTLPQRKTEWTLPAKNTTSSNGSMKR